MFLKGITLKGKQQNNLLIDLDDEYSYMDYYRENTSNYNYIKRKYSSSYSKSGKYIGLYNNDEKLGYFYISCRLSTKPIYKYSSYTRYIDLIEFGFNNNNIEQIYFLLDYLIEYASQNSCNFIQIKTKEKSFIKFYELLQRYPHIIDNDYIYLDIEPVKYDFLNHITNYHDDKTSLKDLYHLYSMGFKIEKDICYFTLYDNEAIIIDRQTKNITCPSRFINIEKRFQKLNNFSYQLLHLIINYNHQFTNKRIDLNYKIRNYNFKFIKVDNELYSFNRELYDNKVQFLDFALRAFKQLNFSYIYFCDKARFKLQTLYSSMGIMQIYLPSYIEKNKR